MNNDAPVSGSTVPDVPPARHMQWQGARTVAEVSAALESRCHIEIQLARSLNHTLFRCFHPDAPPAAVEALDIRADSRLLETLATVPGLEALRDLAGPLAATNATVQLVSPPRLVIQVP